MLRWLVLLKHACVLTTRLGPVHLIFCAFQVVYLPSCVTRMMGPAASDIQQDSVHDRLMSLFAKAGYEVRQCVDVCVCVLAGWLAAHVYGAGATWERWVGGGRAPCTSAVKASYAPALLKSLSLRCLHMPRGDQFQRLTTGL